VDNPSAFGWDWSQTTHDARGSGKVVPEIVDALVAALRPTHKEPGKGYQGWAESVRLYDRDGFALGNVYFGGDRPDVHVISTSAAAHDARQVVRGYFGARTARVDTRLDTLTPFEDLEELLLDAAGAKATVQHIRSTKAGVSTGRTIYLGSATSQVRIRCYEKHLQAPGQYVEGTNRVEVQLRPPSHAKSMVSTWTPAETFGASELSRRVALGLGAEVAHPPSLQKARGTADLEQTLEHMAHQYGPGVDRWLKATGGDVGVVLEHLLRKHRPVA
jgi:hypothetical protein